MKVRIKFRKFGVMKFTGHLDVMRFFQKVMRRGEIPIAFTGGFSPHMIMSFAQPLGVGVTSDGEYLDIEITEPISSEKAVRQMNEKTVEGIEIVSFKEISDDKKMSGMTITAAADYKLTVLNSVKSSDDVFPVPEDWEELVKEFMAREEITVLKKTKKSEKEVNIRPMIYDMHLYEDGIYMFLATGSESNLKPDLVMSTFLKEIGRENTPFHIKRLDVYAKNENGDGFVTLESLGKDIL